MQQITYSSQTTSDPLRLLVDLREILNEARHFNHLHNISGVLYFANGYFFQCLEGEAQHLELLIEKLYKDPRHHRIQFYERVEIVKRNFKEWNMKFVGRQSQLMPILVKMGFDQFLPISFTQSQVNQLIQFLSEIEETDLVEMNKASINEAS